LLIETANVKDAQEILALQMLAYQSEAKIYNDFLIPPLVETLDEMELNFKSYVFLKVTFDGKIIGSVRVYEKDGTCYIGRLIVHPNFQNQGIGAKLLLEIERIYSECGRFELFTGDKSVRNIHLYEKLGYNAFKTEPATKNLTIVFFEKTM
jgi:ribosomal protein S18 acetylase RimI-like enzyme